MTWAIIYIIGWLVTFFAFFALRDKTHNTTHNITGAIVMATVWPIVWLITLFDELAAG